MNCPNCGKEIPVDAAFCAYCGKPAPRSTEESEKALVRPKSGRILAGVAAGMSAYFGLPVVGIRVGLAVLSILTVGVVAVLYVALIFIIPQEQE